MPTITPLLNSEPEVSQHLEIRRGDRVLRHPHVMNIELESKGRHDIPRDAFDGGEPLCLDVGAPIIEVLKITRTPHDRGSVPVKVDGPRLLVGPCLIGLSETIVFSLLVDGPSPRLGPPEQSLTDVEIRRKDSAYGVVARRMRLALLGGAAGAMSIGGIASGEFSTGNHPAWVPTLQAALLTVTVALIGTVLWEFPGLRDVRDSHNEDHD